MNEIDGGLSPEQLQELLDDREKEVQLQAPEPETKPETPKGDATTQEAAKPEAKAPEAPAQSTQEQQVTPEADDPEAKVQQWADGSGEKKEEGSWWNRDIFTGKQVEDSQSDPTAPGSGKGFMYGSGDPNESLVQGLQHWGSDLTGLAAPGLGIVDTATDAVNKVTRLNIPKVKEYEQQRFQAIREISAVVLPTILLGGMGRAAAGGIQARVGHWLGRDPLMKFMGGLGIDTLAGVATDYVAEDQEKSHNLMGMFKHDLGMGWIPDDWATDLENDTPDEIREKNISEGAVTGVVTSFLRPFIKWARAAKKSNEIYGWLPTNERSAAWLEKQRLNGADNIANAKPLTIEEQTAAWYNKKQAAEFEKRGIPANQAPQFDDLGDKAKKDMVDWAEQNGIANKPAETLEDQVAQDVVESAVKRQETLEDIGNVRAQNAPEDALVLGRDDVFDHRAMGARTADQFGVKGAELDQARIVANKGTANGRLRSIYNSGSLERGLFIDNPSKRALYRRAAAALREADRLDYVGKGGLVTSDEMDKAGTELAAKWLDPAMDAEQLKKELDKWRTNTYEGIRYIDDKAYDGIMKATRGYFRDYLELDNLKAAAYLNTSMAGQVADNAKVVRMMEGTEAVHRAQEEILLRLEYLMAEKGVASFVKGRGLNMINRTNRMKDSRKLQAALDNGEIEMGELIKKKYGDARKTVDTLRHINNERPEFLGPMMLAYELSDGAIDTMAKLNKVMENNMGVISKAFFDGAPEIPSVVMEALYAQMYNSILTSISTPAKAGFGNLAYMITRPVSLVMGGVVTKDAKMISRAWIQYSGFMESLGRGFKHMGQVYKMAHSDPKGLNYVMREDIQRISQDRLMLMQSYADSAEEAGNFGPQIIVTQVKELEALANHPVLRFGANAMTAFDGFTRAMIGSAEARIRAAEKILDSGQKLTPENLKAATDAEYKKMFDKSGLITDSEVDYASREIALSLDNKGVDALNNLVKKIPLLKPFFLFPRTQTNLVTQFNSSLPYSVFAKDLNKIAYSDLTKMGHEEMAEILMKRGISTEGDIVQKFRVLRAEMLGKKAMGATIAMYASYQFLNGNLRGNGVYDKEVMKVRQDNQWKPRTYKGLDGKWHSYDGLGIISDWLALFADIGDNATVLGTKGTEDLFQKAMFIVSANLTNKTTMASLEPMMDVLSQNPTAMNKFLAQQASATMIGSGARAELSRLVSPQLREVTQEFFKVLRNRNNFLDVIDPKRALPYKRHWLNGKKVNAPESIWDRIQWAMLPWKTYSAPTPEEQFFIDIEFDVRPIMNKAEDQQEFTDAEKSELYGLMGEDQEWHKAVKTAMEKAQASGFVEKLKEARRNGIGSERGVGDQQFLEKDKLDGIYDYLSSEMRLAKKRAMANASFADELQVRGDNINRQLDMQQRGEIPTNYY